MENNCERIWDFGEPEFEELNMDKAAVKI